MGQYKSSASSLVFRRQSLWPLTAPGLPAIGPGLAEYARQLVGEDAPLAVLAQKIRELLRGYLYSEGQQFPLIVRGRRVLLLTVPGHIWGSDVLGPQPAEVMVVGKMPGQHEEQQRRNFIGPSGQYLLQVCRNLGLKCANWYITNVMKTPYPDASQRGGNIPSVWMKEFLPLLHQELRLVQPRYILCLGADALKAFVGLQATLASVQGAVLEYRYQVGRSAKEGDAWKTAMLTAVVHPASALKNPPDAVRFEAGMTRFRVLLSSGGQGIDEVDHRVVDNLDDLLKLEREIASECQDNIIAVDAEWEGEHPQNSGSYLRTVQLSWKPKTAATIRLRAPGGEIGFAEGLAPALAVINRICRSRIIVGSYLTSDLAWFQDAGLDGVVEAFFSIPSTWQEFKERFTRREGPLGFDIAYALHSVDETASFDLNEMLLRFTSAPRYDAALEEWKAAYRSREGEKVAGYGECPDAILIGEPIPKPEGWDRAGYPVRNSYAAYDADVTRRICLELEPLLAKDAFGNDCWESFWSKMQAAPAILEMNTTGLVVDRARLQELTQVYQQAVKTLEAKIREYARWPTFNLRSVYQVREFLFGEELNGKKADGAGPARLRPEGAISLRLTPVLTTDKRAMLWQDVIDRGLTKEKTPATGKLALAMLAEAAMSVRRQTATGFETVDLSQPVIWLRQHRLLSQTLRYVLRPPKQDESGEHVVSEDGELEYDQGIPAAICDDGRLRGTHLPTKETGRWSVVRPSLQNLSKRREKDYKNILGDQYRWPLRTIIKAPPGHCLVESDYKGAELYVMAVLSGDQTMLSHVTRNQLPEEDPNYYDIHSNVAVLAFNLDCPPTKAGLASVGKKHLRDAAKAVVFGVAYGRGAKAVAVGLREEGVYISEIEAQRLIDTLFEMYPGLVPFFEECRRRVAIRERDEEGREELRPGPGFIGGVYRDYRRFKFPDNPLDVGDLEREAQNFPIQNAVAALVNRAVGHLWRYRQERPEIEYRLVLQIHDAILAYVPNRCVTAYCREVLPECMIRRVPLYRCDLSGQPVSSEPHYLGADTMVYDHWSELMLPDECFRRGFSPELAGWHKVEKGFVHNDVPGKIWRPKSRKRLPDGAFEVVGEFEAVK